MIIYDGSVGLCILNVCSNLSTTVVKQVNSTSLDIVEINWKRMQKPV